MPNIKLIIEYDGTDFKGWQIQPKGQRTVQGVIANTYKKIFKEDIKLIGSGRTDTGVHAIGQVANFKTEINKPPAEILSALNAHLPNDISIVQAKQVPDDFHAQYSAVKKSYRYTILNRKIRSVREHKYSLHFPHELDIDLMKEAAKPLVGRHDFSSFKGNNRMNQNDNNIRTIYDISVKKNGYFIGVDVTADGFMYKMVRNITGLLIEAGAGNISKPMVSNILKSRDRTKAPYAAKAHGLCLMKVWY